MAWSKFLPGLTWSSLRQHYDLIPLFGSVGFGCLLAGGYLARLSLRNPDVAWNRKANPEPWNKWKQTDCYKFVAVRDYKTNTFPAGRPDMSNDIYKGI